MFVVVIAMLVILGITAWVYGLAMMGIGGRGKGRAPGVASRFAEAARNLNGDAETPDALQRFAERHLVRSPGRRP